jgi:hypothetical protein
MRGVQAQGGRQLRAVTFAHFREPENDRHADILAAGLFCSAQRPQIGRFPYGPRSRVKSCLLTADRLP